MSEKSDVCLEDRWAHLRFSIVGSLLSAPPKDGELKPALEALAEKLWLDPVSGEQTTFRSGIIVHRRSMIVDDMADDRLDEQLRGHEARNVSLLARRE